MTFAKYPVSGGGGGGGGDITGPGSSVNNGLVLWNGTGGDVIKDGGVGTANQVLLSNGTTPVFGSIANANVDASAGIAYSKLAALTASRAAVTDGSGFLSTSSATATELGYLAGVTSAIQTQLNAKLNLSGGTMTGALSVANSVTLSGSGSAADYRLWKSGTNILLQYNSAAAFQIQDSGGNRAVLFGPSGYATIGNSSTTGGTHQFTTGIASLPVLYLQNAASAVSLLGFRNNSSTVGVIGASDVDYFAVWDTAALNKQLSVATTGAISIGATGFSGTHAVTGNVAFDTDTLFVDASNNRVGVGTASPNVLLEASSATGSASPTPSEIRISTTTSASDWSTTSPWGRLSFYSADASGGGPKIQAAITATATSTLGAGVKLDFLVDNESGTLTQAMQLSPSGAVTLGASSDTPYTSFHTINKNIYASTPSDTTSANGSFYIGSNLFTSSGRQPTRLTGLTGAAIGFINGNTDTTNVILFKTNLQADSATDVGEDAGKVTAAGAWVLGPSSADAISHTLNGSIILTTAPSNAFSSGVYKSIGSTGSQILMSDGTAATNDLYLFGGGYYNGANHYGQNANHVLTRLRVNGVTSDASNAFRISKMWNGSYTSTAQTTTLNTEVTLLDVTAAGAVTLGPSAGGVRHVISGAYSVGPENVNSSATSQNNYDVGDTSWLESITGATFTGFAAKENGRVLHIVGYNGSITINHDSASSTSTNRVILKSGANTTSRGFILIYSSTGGRWIQVG